MLIHVTQHRHTNLVDLRINDTILGIFIDNRAWNMCVRGPTCRDRVVWEMRALRSQKDTGGMGTRSYCRIACSRARLYRKYLDIFYHIDISIN